MTAPQLPLFAVRRSLRARRARLTLTELGEPLVVLPARAPDDIAAQLVARHLEWLQRHQRRIARERAALRPLPPFGHGRTLSMRGLEHRVLIDAPVGRRASVELVVGAPPTILVRRAPGDPKSVVELLQGWLRAEARREIEVAVAGRATEMGLSPTAISVRDQRTRWGSASARGALSFSWRLLLAPPAVLDYVVVHELAHLRWRGHGPRFWQLVMRHVADADAQRRWLRHNHRALHAALDEGSP